MDAADLQCSNKSQDQEVFSCVSETVLEKTDKELGVIRQRCVWLPGMTHVEVVVSVFKGERTGGGDLL